MPSWEPAEALKKAELYIKLLFSALASIQWPSVKIIMQKQCWSHGNSSNVTYVTRNWNSCDSRNLTFPPWREQAMWRRSTFTEDFTVLRGVVLFTSIITLLQTPLLLNRQRGRGWWNKYNNQIFFGKLILFLSLFIFILIKLWRQYQIL